MLESGDNIECKNKLLASPMTMCHQKGQRIEEKGHWHANIILFPCIPAMFLRRGASFLLTFYLGILSLSLSRRFIYLS
jgi:hypothetical protein